jgi:hypothetical protein
VLFEELERTMAVVMADLELFSGTRGQELRLVIFTTSGFRVAAVPIPAARA